MGHSSVGSEYLGKRGSVEKLDLREMRSNLCIFCTYWILLTFEGVNVVSTKSLKSLFYLSIEAVDFFRWKN